ncbi:hypothetical protein C8Q77DRAFT_342654 [Trametes polyzona]|nr:hypothetical protein C8Q77DRAFT_342654 [Trametes polyzona]
MWTVPQTQGYKARSLAILFDVVVASHAIARGSIPRIRTKDVFLSLSIGHTLTRYDCFPGYPSADLGVNVSL